MARPRLLVLSSERLNRLDALLVAAGAERGHVVGLDDALELFSTEAAEGAMALIDLDATPLTDAGLLRRWCEQRPDLRLLWIGDDPESIEAFAAAGVQGTALRWPLDLEDLGRLARGDAEAPSAPNVDLTEASPASDEDPAVVHAPATERRNGTGQLTDLSRIEAILGQEATTAAGPEQAVSPTPPPPARPRSAEPVEPRSAFLPAQQEPRRTGPAEAASAPPATQAGPTPRLLEPLDMNEPLLTEEEIEAFFALDEPTLDPQLDPVDESPVDEEPLPVAPLATEPLATEPLATEPLATEPVTVEASPLPPEGALTAAEDESGAVEEDLEIDGTAVRAGVVADQRPSWLKDQTADLADIVQTLDLSARAHHAHVGLEGELARLRQFTRTIGFVAAPPPRGEQEFDLAVLVEEQLGGLAGREPDAPRLLFRRSGNGTTVEADKLLVTMALEALLQTAIGCAGAGDVVRVSVETGDGAGPTVRIRFPAGPLRDLAAADVLQPYSLKARLPQIGSNALAAAGAIAVGQGGDLVLHEEGPDVRVFEVSFSARREA